MGSGDQILFWEDSWVGGGTTLKEKFPELYQISSQKLQTVASMGSFYESGWEWKFSWRRNLFDNEMGRASAFIDQTAAISPNATLKDSWVYDLIWEVIEAVPESNKHENAVTRK